MKKTLSNPHSIVWSYFEALRRLGNRVELEENESIKKQDTSVCVILSVTIVEVFMNVYFRVLISEEQYKHAEEEILNDLNMKISLDKKINKWPNLIFGEKIDFGSGAGQKFSMLKKLRNSLVHFSSTHETFKYPGIIINGMADTSSYESLAEVSPKETIEIAENFLCEIFKMRGVKENDLCHSLHSWTGKVPNILS